MLCCSGKQPEEYGFTYITQSRASLSQWCGSKHCIWNHLASKERRPKGIAKGACTCIGPQQGDKCQYKCLCDEDKKTPYKDGKCKFAKPGSLTVGALLMVVETLTALGLDVLAGQDIMQGTFICEYVGVVSMFSKFFRLLLRHFRFADGG